jgi:hypothetical protein
MEVSRPDSGVFNADHERGSRFRAQSSGQQWGKAPADSVWKSIFSAQLGRCLKLRKERHLREKKYPEVEQQKGNAQPRGAKFKARKRKKGMCLEDRPVLEPNAAGIDVGAREMFVAVAAGRDERTVDRLALPV